MKNDELIIKPKRPKGEDGYRLFSIRIKEELVDRIDKLSTETGRSRNELIGIFIEFAMDRCKIEGNE